MRIRGRVAGLRSPPHRQSSFRLLDGDWLEPRTLLAASPLETAVPLHFGAFNDAQVSHFLSVPDEFDLYSVTLQKGETLDASIDAQNAGSALTSLLRVFNANGTPLALDNQLGGDPQLTFQASTAGTYYIGVSSAPNNNYNPTVMYSGVPGATTGLYTLNVTLTTSAPLMPDLTGSSFRTGVDMAAAGDTIPVNFTVQNRGGADPGNFQVQVLLVRQQYLRQLLAGAGDVYEGGTGGRRDGPRLLVAGRLQRDAAGRLSVGARVPRPAHRRGPGGARGRLVRQERRPSRLGLGAADGRHPRSRRRDGPVASRCRTVHGNHGNARPGPGEHLVVRGQQHSGQRGVEGGGRRHQRHAAAPADALRTDGPDADPVGQRPDRPVAATGDVLSDRLGASGCGCLPAHHGVHPDQSALRPAHLRSRHRLRGGGGLERRRHPRHRHRQPDRRHGERVSGQRRRHLSAAQNLCRRTAGVACHAGRRDQRRQA